MGVAEILSAARADGIPTGTSGLWSVTRRTWDCPVRFTSVDGHNTHLVVPGTYTFLLRVTEGTLDTETGCEAVMNDTPPELLTHLRAMQRAQGRVLVTGLGLGCVVRGMLAGDRVREVVVLERESDVLHLVGPHMPSDPRLRIVHAEAEDWLRAHPSDRFDWAWHDVWTDREAGEDHLQVKHSRLMLALLGRVRVQGAWSMPKRFGRTISRATAREWSGT